MSAAQSYRPLRADTLEELLRGAGHRIEKWLESQEKALTVACTVRDRFRGGDAETKKEILHSVGSNLTLTDKILHVQALEPFLVLQTVL